MAASKAKSRARDTRTAIERDLDERRERIRKAWTRRHPEAAASDRALRKGRAILLDRWSHKNQGTPETHEHASQRNQGALARLYQSGAIDAEQLAAAVDIATVAERISADVTVRTASLEARVDVTRMGDGSFYERLGQVRREAAYTRWRGLLPQRGPVLEMLTGDQVGFTIVARRYRMHNRRAKQLLIDALDLWAGVLGTVCKEIDDQALDAAHARIAAR